MPAPAVSSPPLFRDALHGPSALWAAWVQAADARERERQTRSAATQANQERPCPCEGLDPFCPRCVPYGRHLDANVHRRRREVWAAQDRARAKTSAQQRRAEEAEGLAWLQDLTRLREAAGLTQAALAGKVGVAARTIRRIETTGHTPRPALARRLARALDLERPAKAP